MMLLGRLGQPEDITDVVALLVSHGGRWLTGQVSTQPTEFARGPQTRHRSLIPW
jgi:hypothetical protein